MIPLLLAFPPCVTGPGQYASECCLHHYDLDADGDVDLEDHAAGQNGPELWTDWDWLLPVGCCE